jgi:hypothetical protein
MVKNNPAYYQFQVLLILGKIPTQLNITIFDTEKYPVGKVLPSTKRKYPNYILMGIIPMLIIH